MQGLQAHTHFLEESAVDEHLQALDDEVHPSLDVSVAIALEALIVAAENARGEQKRRRAEKGGDDWGVATQNREEGREIASPPQPRTHSQPDISRAEGVHEPSKHVLEPVPEQKRARRHAARDE